VYMIDWYDQQHCHNPNTERWDRSNGRIYRMKWEATYKPVKVDLGSKSDLELAALLLHKNEWHARTAQRLLSERAMLGRTNGKASDANVVKEVLHTAKSNVVATHRLKGLWTAHAMGLWDADLAMWALRDEDEYVRAWAVQLSTDSGKMPPANVVDELIRLAAKDPSPVVRLYLASAIQRLPEQGPAWQLVARLAAHAEDQDDRNLPLLLWDSVALRMPQVPMAARAVAQNTPLPQLADSIFWYAATLPEDSLEPVLSLIAQAKGDVLRRRLAGLWLALEPRKNLVMPAAWKQMSAKLYRDSDSRVQRQAERIAAVFGDNSAFPRLREALASTRSDTESRKHAFAVLSRAQDALSLPIFLGLIDDKDFRTPAINLLGRFDDPKVPAALIGHFEQFPKPEQALALNTLATRSSFALALLDAVASGKIKRDQLTAYHIRQLTELKNPEVDKRLTATWGKIHQSPVEKQALMNKLQKVFDEAPLWAYDANTGHQHFQKLCATCHRIGEEGARLGPELTGAGKHGIRYFLENIIDPDAVVGTDFQMTTLETKSGDTLSGLITKESGENITLRTIAAEMNVAKSDISKRETSAKSLMPEGLLEALSPREQIELLKFLTTH
ncbi:MAG TPA: c-type cytochrome, partial [Candidatus Saccharimonadales bacterium]|nr:c-type cytochrome [Candidatus Saccharimonadales bacterium]